MKWSYNYDKSYHTSLSSFFSGESKSAPQETKEGHPLWKEVPLLWSNQKTVCGICVVSYGIEIMKLNFYNKKQEKSAVFV